jgi:hypothetical protein
MGAFPIVDFRIFDFKEILELNDNPHGIKEFQSAIDN